MSNTSKTPSHDSARRKQQYLAQIRHCRHIDREYKTAELIFSHLSTKADYQLAWPSEESLAKTTGQNIRTIKQHITCLQALGVFTVKKLGGSQFRTWAEREYGLGPEVTRASTKSRHLMNIYLPCWDSAIARTGEPTEEQVQKFHELKAARRQGKAPKGDTGAGRIVAQVPSFGTATGGTLAGRIVAQVPPFNSGTGGSLNSGTGAPLSGGGKQGPSAPVSKELVESDLGVPPTAADQTEPPLFQGVRVGNQATTPQPCQALGPGATNLVNPGPGPLGGNTGKVSPAPRSTESQRVAPALPVNDQDGFMRFLARWDHLAQTLATWKPMTNQAQAKWARAWDNVDTLRESIDRVIDMAAANPYLTGLKAGRVPFEMEPTFLLGMRDGSPVYALVAEGRGYYDFKEPIETRVNRLLNRHPLDALAALATSDDFYDHERLRAAELLGELSRERAEAAARKAERDARASLVATEMADVAYRLATLEALPLIGGLDDLQEYLDGLVSCPSAEGKELIGNSLYRQVRYFNQWHRLEDYTSDLLSALVGVEGAGAERLRENLVSPKFQQGKARISRVINDLRQLLFPVSGYILINRSASACNASASVTW